MEAAMALVVCRWHHAHQAGMPIPCPSAEHEAAALINMLDAVGITVMTKEAASAVI